MESTLLIKCHWQMHINITNITQTSLSFATVLTKSIWSISCIFCGISVILYFIWKGSQNNLWNYSDLFWGPRDQHINDSIQNIMFQGPLVFNASEKQCSNKLIIAKILLVYIKKKEKTNKTGQGTGLGERMLDLLRNISNILFKISGPNSESYICMKLE